MLDQMREFVAQAEKIAAEKEREVERLQAVNQDLKLSLDFWQWRTDTGKYALAVPDDDN